MKKFIRNLFWFLTLLLFVYPLILLGWGFLLPNSFSPNLLYKRSTTGMLGHRLENIKDYYNVDVLFLGSSIAYRGFDTEKFNMHGLKSFNLGSSAQTPMQTNVLLQRYYSRLNPKLVIYEVYPPAFSWDGVESSIDLISYDHNDVNSLRMGMKTMNISVINTLLFSFIIRSIGEDYFPIDLKYDDSDTYIEGGFVKRKEQFNNKHFHSSTSINLEEENLTYFRSNIKIINGNGAHLVFVWLPNTTNYYKSLSNINYFDSLMNMHGDYINLNELLVPIMDDSLHFYDPYHLNHNGTKIVNDTLISLIKYHKIFNQ